MRNKDYKFIGAMGLFVFLPLLLFVQFVTNKTETNSAIITQQAEYKSKPAPYIPEGYTAFGEGEWLTEDTWQCMVIEPDESMAGISYDYPIKVLMIHVIGSGYGYTIQQLFNIDGTISTIPFDGNTWG